MKRLSHRLLIISLIATLTSFLSFASLPTASRAANTKGEALIAVAHRNPTSDNPSNDYRLQAMDEWGNITAINTPSAINKSLNLQFVGNLFITAARPDSIEVIDLASGTDTLYPAPLRLEPLSGGAPQGSYLNLFDVVSVKGGKQLLLDANAIWYLLDLASGTYTRIDVANDDQHPLYFPFAQSPADGLLYANWGCYCLGVPQGVARYDLQGNREVLDLHLGNYVRAGEYLQVGEATMSPAGYYLYFLARDPNQAMPPRNAPGIDANVIMRYRISDGTSSVIVRAAPGNIINDYTLTSNDPDITYTEVVPGPNYNSADSTKTMQHWLIRRVNLATHDAPETLIASSSSLGRVLWCGSNFYYDYFTDGGPHVASYSPGTGATAQTEGQLLGCAP